MKRKGFFSRFGHSPVFRGAAVMLVALAWSSPAIGSQDTTNTPATPTDARTIFDAVKSGDLAKVRALLKSNPDLVNSKDTNDWTPLLLATIGRNEDVMELLIASNADVNATNNFGDTPLVSAVMGPGKGEKWTEAKKEAQIARVKLLLAHNVDLNSQEEALLWAVGRGDREIAELLLASRADVNGRDKHGETPLHEAARNWREDVWSFHSGVEV